MSRRFDTSFSIAVGMCLISELGLAVALVLEDVSTVLNRTTLAFWGLIALSLALTVTGTAWLLALRARLGRNIAGR